MLWLTNYISKWNTSLFTLSVSLLSVCLHLFRFSSFFLLLISPPPIIRYIRCVWGAQKSQHDQTHFRATPNHFRNRDEQKLKQITHPQPIVLHLHFLFLNAIRDNKKYGTHQTIGDFEIIWWLHTKIYNWNTLTNGIWSARTILLCVNDRYFLKCSCSIIIRRVTLASMRQLLANYIDSI